MSLSVAYVALFTGVAVWLLLVWKLSTKSWETATAAHADLAHAAHGPPPAKVGLWVFLAVVTSLFALFLTAYSMRMGGHGHGADDWMAMPEPSVLWLNTAVLIFASLAMQWARATVRGGQIERTGTALMLGGLLTLLFLAGQYYAWWLMRTAEFFTLRNPAVAFFYLLTGVHGLHLLGGLYVWARTALRLRRQDVELIDVALSVQLCAVYWHYLLLVWLAVFTVMLST